MSSSICFLGILEIYIEIYRKLSVYSANLSHCKMNTSKLRHLQLEY
jgi:hypothetical protein